jgi:acyl-CoA dehydrogenase
MQIHQTFLDRCIELLVDHKLTSESASMIKYSATDMCGMWSMNACSYLAVMGICGIINCRMYADNHRVHGSMRN